MGTGPGAIERAVTFFSELYGTAPEFEKRMPDKSVLKWTVPTQPGLATTFVRYITIETEATTFGVVRHDALSIAVRRMG